MKKNITTPLTEEVTTDLTAGDIVSITGVIYSARDAAHKRMAETLAIKDAVIYYLGPSPAREGQVIGSAGPTTSGRMDAYTPQLLELGLRGMIGKGKRSAEVIETMKKTKAVYFAAVGGAGALLSKHITKSEVIAYDDLGTEAIHKLYVEDFPAIVVIDCKGNSLYK